MVRVLGPGRGHLGDQGAVVGAGMVLPAGAHPGVEVHVPVEEERSRVRRRWGMESLLRAAENPEPGRASSVSCL